MFLPLPKNLIEIDTSETTQFDGGYNFSYRNEKCMKTIEVGMNVKVKVGSINFVYGVNGGRSFYKFRIGRLNKHKKALVGDTITIINRLRLESDYENVNVIDVTIEKITKFKQRVDFVFTSKSNKTDYDEDFNNSYGLVETNSGYNGLLQA